MTELDIIKSNFVETIKSSFHVCNIEQKGDEVSIRCPFCGDSKKNPFHTHFYIKTSPPFPYFCQRCSKTGIFSNKTLNEFETLNLELSDYLFEVNNSDYVKQQRKQVKSKQKHAKKLIIPKTIGIETEELNVEFINNRFGRNIITSEEDIQKYKVILNFSEFLRVNYITNYTRKEGVMHWINNNFVGFLNFDKTKIVFRNRDITHEVRYIVYDILGIESVESNLYTIQTDIDILTEKVNIVIAEGVFDLISIYDLYKDEYDLSKTIFISNLGKNFLGSIEFIIKKGFLDFNKIDIYSDSEVNVNYYKRLKNRNKFLNRYNINVFYNNKAEDFGVNINNIEKRLAKI